MDAIITAGGIPLPEDRLYSETRGHSKALLDIAGKPMIQWVLDALSAAKSVDKIIIVGLTDKTRLVCSKPIHYVPNRGKILDNLRAGAEKSLELGRQHKHALFVSSDIPAVRAEMVDWVITAAMQSDDDIYYNVIPREVMEKRFPDSHRTYVHLKDMQITGGGMNVACIRTVLKKGEAGLLESIFDSRKSPLKQASLVGFGTLFLLLFRQLTLEELATRTLTHLGLTGRAIVCPYAEVGMDVDKPGQLEILRKDLKKQQKKAEKKKGK
jgi:GTP:adenosylcobinamide-phosphate guanylyltransferase